MNTAIDLSFSDDTVEVVMPQDKIPLCMGRHPCPHFYEKPDYDEGGNLLYHQWFCRRVNMPVFEIWRQERVCPRGLWFKVTGESITFHATKKPIPAEPSPGPEQVLQPRPAEQDFLDGYRDDRGGPKVKRRRPNRRDH